MFSKFQFLDAVMNPLQKIKASLKQAITKQKVQITQIIPNKLYYTSPPTSENIESLLQELRTVNQFQIWNFGEYSYNEQILIKLLDGRERNSDGKQIVYNLTYEYFANIPFCEMIKSIQNIEAFLSLNDKNRVYIHCQDNKRRSAIFLASYIFLTGLETDIVSSILKVNKILNISIQEKQKTHGPSASGAIYKSQHLVLKNIMNYINNSSFINKNGWNLKKILINNAPKIHLVLRLQNFSHQKLSTIKFKVLLEIRSIEGIIYKKIFQDQFIEGESLCLRIPETETVVLKDDFLIIVKYVYEKKGYSILRAQLNTNFIYDPYFRVQRNDMDLSVNNAHPQNDTVFMDLLLESNPKEFSDLSQLSIAKENVEAQKISETENKQIRKSSFEKESRKQEEEEEEGFGILDEEQQAEHNQKMQREIEQELARELQNIRKKRNQEGKKSQESIENQNQKLKNMQVSRKTNTETEKSQSESEKQRQNTTSISNKDTQTQKSQSEKIYSPQLSNPSSAKQLSPKKPQQKDLISKNQQGADGQESQEGSQEQSSSEEESSEEQAQQQEEDLDEYLSKLQNQAEKHE